MGFAQAYYTSCQAGLSDFAGFQFNAATPGLSAQVLREVEALTSYQPPHWLGYHPSAAEIAACPVNLVYHCEPTTVLANVVFVGLDSSRRLGNYFAHALIRESTVRDPAGPDSTGDPDGFSGFDPILPIELWESSIWASDPISERELPNLSELPGPSASNPMNRARVERFLAGRRCSEQLVTLVTAAQNAVLGQGPSIVIIEPDNTAAALWIGAISFLLPAPLARRMSFATYRQRPEYCDAHVIATVPEPDLEPGDRAFPGYVVFDTRSGWISSMPEEPAADLLVRAGPSRAAGLWERAAQLIEPPGVTLAAWHPALALAALLTGTPVSDTDLDALGEWGVIDLDESPGATDGEAARAGAITDQAPQPRHHQYLRGRLGRSLRRLGQRAAARPRKPR
jgi:GTPase-associated protein 1, N-terminal domain type 2/GTPase-associated protein 1, middle domain